MGLLFPPFSTQKKWFCRPIHTQTGKSKEKFGERERFSGRDGSSDEEEGAEEVQDQRLYP